MGSLEVECDIESKELGIKRGQDVRIKNESKRNENEENYQNIFVPYQLNL